MRRRARLLSLLATVALVGGSTVVGAVPAYAGGCWASGCVGWDPGYQGCATDSQTTSTAWHGAAEIIVYDRHSYGCDSNWAAAHMNTAAANAGDSLLVFIRNSSAGDFMCSPTSAPSQGSGRTPEDCSGRWYNTGYPWTDMVAGSSPTYAEADLYDGSGNFIASAQITWG
jgi:hypothetical protein